MDINVKVTISKETVDLVERLISAIESNAPKTIETTINVDAKELAKEVTKKVEEVSDTEMAEPVKEEPISEDALREEIKALSVKLIQADKSNRAKIQALVKNYGVAKTTQIKAEDLSKFLKELSEVN